MPEIIKTVSQLVKYHPTAGQYVDIDELPAAEQVPFRQFLRGKPCPIIPNVKNAAPAIEYKHFKQLKKLPASSIFTVD